MPPLEDEILEYHRSPRPGKIEVVPLKPTLTQHDLSLAYTPGVALPCLKIHKEPFRSFEYTARGNLVAVVTNGSAVLGLGNIGPLAGKPVMEGKAVLFKRFADLDVFDLEIDADDPDTFIETVACLEPTFGGINLEDIRAPDCFYIEETLKKRMSIPVFHDDQHGTAIISGAALINACELTGRKLADLQVVINGAGAAALACGKMYLQLGVRPENLVLVDSRGVIYQGRREGMNEYKAAFASKTERRTLAEAVEGIDALVGLSVKGAFSAAILRRLAANPIIFALANPDPEVDYGTAKQIRPDAIVATGRSDYPNQVNNVLGFPFIFRGALDVRARQINEAMKLAAVNALAALAREDVPDAVIRAYGGRPTRFGPEYIIPKPLDSRALLTVVPAVAEAAVRSGVAGLELPDRTRYLQRLETILGPDREIMRRIVFCAKQDLKRIVLPDGANPVMLRAANQVQREKIARPVLLGDPERIQSVAADCGVPLDDIEIVNPPESGHFDEFADHLYRLRRRKGWSAAKTRRMLQSPYVYGAMMVRRGLVDGQVHGIVQSYPEAIRPVLWVIPRREGVAKVSGVYLMIFRDKTLLFADATVNIHPDAEALAEIAVLAAEMAEFFSLSPRVAILSFSNFGSTRHPDAARAAEAVQLARRRRPDLAIDGEMQADTAVTGEILLRDYAFNRLGGTANVLVFPDLIAGNVAYKLLARLGGAIAVGPLLMGLSRPFNVVQDGSDMETVVNVIAITAAQAQAACGIDGAP